MDSLGTTYRDTTRMNQTPLSQFHPLVAKWFAETIGKPTDAQAQAWPKIANGEHVLVTAPTGSGKTLTAFLWAINQLVTEELPSDTPASSMSHH